MQTMTLEQAEARAAELGAQIRRHDQLYYKDCAPEITDREYDALMAELIAIEEKFSISSSPTQAPGSDLSDGDFPSAEHPVPMLSISNTYTPDEVRKFVDLVQRAVPGEKVYCELKIDGMAATLLYDGGYLRYAATRGNGKIGDVITSNALACREVPRVIPYKGKVEVRGEFYFGLNQFALLNRCRAKEGLQPFANPRNAVAGTMKQKDSQEVQNRRVNFFAHGVGLIDLADVGVKTNEELVRWFEKMGFKSIPFGKIGVSYEKIVEAIGELDQERNDVDFETDGAVLKVNTLASRPALGATGKSPRWTVAYKYATEQAVTTLTGVDWQVGRTGAVTPVARFETVDLCGTKVSNATLHNYAWMRQFDLRIGDKITIEKGGEIIPKVISSEPGPDHDDRPALSHPDHCPCCGTPLIVKDRHVYCSNEACPDRVILMIRHYASRNAMDIEGLGEKLVRQLVESGKVKTLPDLYELKRDDLAEMDRMGVKSADKIMKAIWGNINPTLPRFIFALGIRHVGISTAKDLAAHFRTIEAFIHADRDEVYGIEGIGDIVADSIDEWLKDELNISMLNDLSIKYGIEPQETKVIKEGGPFAGKIFVVTGTLWLDRNEVKEMIEERGGKVTGSVSGKTHVLVVGEEPGSNKVNGAKKFGTEVWDEAKLKEMISL